MRNNSLAVVLAASLVGCSQAIPNTLLSSHSAATVRRDAAAQTFYALDASTEFFAGPGYVDAYTLGGVLAPRRFSKGINQACAVAVDGDGTLYLANYHSVLVYAPGTSVPERTITTDINGAFKVIVGANGTLYVANYKMPITGYIAVYPKGASSPTRILTDPNAGDATADMRVDDKGRLFVADYSHYVYVYHSTGDRPYKKFKGISRGVALALDSRDNLYVSDYYAHAIDIFSLGATTPSRKITKDLWYPDALTLDSSGNLYVANVSKKRTPSIVVLSSDGRLLRKIVKGIENPMQLLFDASGNLYVDNHPAIGVAGSVAVYPPGSNVPSTTLSDPAVSIAITQP